MEGCFHNKNSPSEDIFHKGVRSMTLITSLATYACEFFYITVLLVRGALKTKTKTKKLGFCSNQWTPHPCGLRHQKQEKYVNVYVPSLCTYLLGSFFCCSIKVSARYEIGNHFLVARTNTHTHTPLDACHSF